MDTPILSDIKVLDNLLALSLNVNLWSARKKMVLEDSAVRNFLLKIWPLWVPSVSLIPIVSRCSPL